MNSKTESNNIEQHSKDWLQDRLGMLTGSMAHAFINQPKEYKPSTTIKAKVDWIISKGEEYHNTLLSINPDLSKLKNKDFEDLYNSIPPDIIDDLLPGAITYITKKVGERMTGWREPEEFYTKEMKWGNVCEPEHRKRLSAELGVEVETCSFVMYDEFFGASPDGKTSEHSWEGKSPYYPGNHLKNFDLVFPEDLKALHTDYFYQVYSEMLCLGLKKAYFSSYDPRQQKKWQLHILEVNWDPVEGDRLIYKINQASEYFKLLLKKFEQPC